MDPLEKALADVRHRVRNGAGVRDAISQAACERRLDAAALEKRAIRTFGDLEAMNRRMRALRKAFNLQAEDSGLVAVERTGQMPFWDEVFGLIERGLSPRNYAAAVERLLDTRQPGLHPGVLALLLDASA